MNNSIEKISQGIFLVFFFLFFILVTTALSDKSDEHNLYDLSGEWYSYALFSGGNWEGWDYGKVNIDTDGTWSTWQWSDSDGETENYDAGAFEIDSAGILRIPDMQNPPFYIHGKMSVDKNRITFISKDLVPDQYGNVGYAKFEMVKGGGTFETSDLAGQWYSYALFSGGDWEGWDYGKVDIGTNGTWSTWQWSDSDGETGNYGASAFEIDPAGILRIPDMQNSPIYIHGKMSRDKNRITFISKDLVPDQYGNVDYAKFEMVKGGGTFNASDITGEWQVLSLESGGNHEGWHHGTVLINSDGSMEHGSLTREDGHLISVLSGNLNCSIQGVVTGNFVTDEGNIGIVSGKMTIDKNTIVSVCKNSSSIGKMIFIKSSQNRNPCGAYIAPGVWKEFDCYNLAAIGKVTGAYPFTPSWELNGGYWQWGRKGPDPDEIDWYNTDTEHFAHGPTGPGLSEANEGEISGWDQTYAPDGAWSDSIKTANDPCPEGFRIPTQTQWQGVLDNNIQSKVGMWSSSYYDYTNYSAARFFGSDLMLPAAGGRFYKNGYLSYRGNISSYWSSSDYSSSNAWYMYFGSSYDRTGDAYRRHGFSIRCVADNSSACTYGLSPGSGNLDSDGGNISVSVTASGSSCAWTTTNGLPWVSLSPTDGTGNGTVTITVSANTGVARSGSVTIAGKIYTISQEASPALQGFDKTYYLNSKLAQLKAIDPATWNSYTTAALEAHLANYGFTPESHYKAHGWAEGLSPNAFFDQGQYLYGKGVLMFQSGGYGTISEAIAAFKAAWPYDPYQHYVKFGAAEGLNPLKNFDEDAYLADKLADLAMADPSKWGARDIAYLRDFLASAGMTPFSHYLAYGEKEGNPGPYPVTSGLCTYGLLPSRGNLDSDGGNISVSVTASGSSCAWTTTNDLPWVSLSPTDGTGNGTVTITVSANPGVARSGSVTIAGKIYTISQAASPALQGFDKTYYLNSKLAQLKAIDPATWNSVTTATLEAHLANYGFTAESHYKAHGWAEGLSPNAFFDQGQYLYGKGVLIFQSGGYGTIPEAIAAFKAAWPYDPYQHYVKFGAAEGLNPLKNFDEDAYLADKLADLAMADPSKWGARDIDYLRAFLAAAGMSPFSHYLAYGEKEGNPGPYPVTSEPCALILSHSSDNFTSSGGTISVSVTASSSDCPWTTSNDLPWVSLSTSGGTGNGTVTITVSANTGVARSGSVTIAGQTYNISQDAVISNNACGAYVAPGVWKEFDCYNLAAIGKVTGADPFTPSWELNGGYWQWGRKGPDPNEIDWYNTNTEHFAYGPTGPGLSEANEGEISGWDETYAPDGAWSDSYKTANDPCPGGFRIPTKSQWEGVLVNNIQNTVGTWSSTPDDHTNFSSARFLGDALMLPFAGNRGFISGGLGNRGSSGWYWSSSELSGEDYAWFLNVLKGNATANYYFERSGGLSVRCIADDSSACTYGLSPSSSSLDSDGGNISVSVTASGSSCAWTTTNDLPWVSLSTTGGTGSGSISVTVAPNTGIARSGSISIAGQPYAVSQAAPLDQTVVILTETSPDHTITSGSDVQVFGTEGSNQITLESGAKAELIYFPGFNTVQIQSSSDAFQVSRSGTVVTFTGSDGTVLKIPATSSVQTIAFTDQTLSLTIHNNQVMLDDLVITLIPGSIKVQGNVILPQSEIYTLSNLTLSNPDFDNIPLNANDGTFEKAVTGQTDQVDFMILADELGSPVLLSIDLQTGDLDFSPASTALALVMTDPVLAFDSKQLTGEIMDEIKSLYEIYLLETYISEKISNNKPLILDPEDNTLLQYIYAARNAAIGLLGLDSEAVSFLENTSRSYKLPYSLLSSTSCEETYRLNPLTQNGEDSGVSFEVVDCSEKSAVKLKAVNRFSRYVSVYEKTDDINESYDVGTFLVNVSPPPTPVSLTALSQVISGNWLNSSKEFVLDFTTKDSYTLSVVGPSFSSLINEFPENIDTCWPSYWRTVLNFVVLPAITIISQAEISEFITHAEPYIELFKKTPEFILLVSDTGNAESFKEAMFILGNGLMTFLLKPEKDNPETNLLLRITREIQEKSLVGQRTQWEKGFVNLGKFLHTVNIIKKATDAGWKLVGTLTSLSKLSGLGTWVAKEREPYPLDFRIAPLSGTVKTDESVIFEAEITGGSGSYSYEWDFGDGTTSTDTNPNHAYMLPGDYTVTLTVSDSKGTTATSTMIVTVTSGNSSGRICGAYITPSVWKEFDCYNLAAIGKTTNDDPFTPSWRLIGGYWQWGRKGPDPSQWFNKNTDNFAHGPTAPDLADANAGAFSDWDQTYAPDGAWSDSHKTANDPCPAGFRVPTIINWDGVGQNNTHINVGTWSNSATNYSTARFFGSDLMLPAAGFRNSSGALSFRGYRGDYWSSSQVSSIHAWPLGFSGEGYGTGRHDRVVGCSVRCIADDSSACTYGLLPSSSSLDSDGGTSSVSVTASGSSCAWTTTNDLPWVSLSPIDGTGNGTVTITVSVNPGVARSGSVTIAGKIYTITQEAAISTNVCGAYVAPGVWKEFDCYNLAAIGKVTGADPFTPSWELNGGYWQWGRKGPDSSQWYDNNTEHFAHAPTGPGAGEANEGEINGWDQTYADQTYAPDGAWSDGYKTVNDPCPDGFRVPTKTQWEGVLNNNTQSKIGTWSSSLYDYTNYSAARFFGDDLMLTAAGSRSPFNGSLDSRGAGGFYWSSSENGTNGASDLSFSSTRAVSNSIYRLYGHSIRCVAEGQTSNEILQFTPEPINPILSNLREHPHRIYKNQDRYRLYFQQRINDGSYPQDFDLDLKVSDFNGLTESGINFDTTNYNVISSVQSGKTFNYYAAELIENGVYKVWHSATDDSNIGGMSVYFSNSTDGISFTGQGAVNLPLSSYPEYDSRGIREPFILKIDDTYHMYYQAYPGYTSGPPDPSLDHTIAYAVSSDGQNWTKHGIVIEKGEGGAFDDNSIGLPCVVYDGNVFEMFYRAHDGEELSIGYAVSSDGLNWQKSGKIQGINGSPVGVFKNSQEYELWYVTSPATYLRELNVAKAPVNKQ